MSERVVVSRSRAARIREIVDIPFSYPHEEKLTSTEDFLERRERGRQEVMQEHMMQVRDGEEQL